MIHGKILTVSEYAVQNLPRRLGVGVEASTSQRVIKNLIHSFRKLSDLRRRGLRTGDLPRWFRVQAARGKNEQAQQPAFSHPGGERRGLGGGSSYAVALRHGGQVTAKGKR